MGSQLFHFYGIDGKNNALLSRFLNVALLEEEDQIFHNIDGLVELEVGLPEYL